MPTAPLAVATFLWFMIGALVLILWGAAIGGVIPRRQSGLQIAAIITLLIVVPVIGPILYWVFRRHADQPSAEEAAAAEADMRRERAGHSAGGSGMWN